MSELTTAGAIAELGNVGSVRDRFNCSKREAEQLLVLARRKVAQGYGNAVMDRPPQVTVRRSAPPAKPLSAEQQEFGALLDKYLNPREPSVDERMHAQWVERNAEVTRRNLANGYGATDD